MDNQIDILLDIPTGNWEITLLLTKTKLSYTLALMPE